jgi:hypothetical protein
VYKFKVPARTYTGEFRGDTMTGRGILEFEEKKMVYEGDFVNGLMSGKRGKMVFNNGMSYEG